MKGPLALLLLSSLVYAVLAYDEIFEPPEIAMDDEAELESMSKTCDFKCKAQAGRISNMYYNSGKWLNVYVDRKFSCKGKVSRWVFFAKKRGKIFFSVWRPGSEGWTMVGKNLVRVKKGDVGGVVRYDVPDDDQISVRKDDCIGIQYPRLDPDQDLPEDRGVVPYNNTEDFPWENPSSEGMMFEGLSGPEGMVPEVLETPQVPENYSGPSCPKGYSRLINEQIYDDDINPSEPKSEFRFFCRRAAFAAYVCPRGGGGGGGYDCKRPNPCRSPHGPPIIKDLFYYPHKDRTMFVQCSEWGQCYEMPCGPGLVWNQRILTCVRPRRP